MHLSCKSLQMAPTTRNIHADRRGVGEKKGLGRRFQAGSAFFRGGGMGEAWRAHTRYVLGGASFTHTHTHKQASRSEGKIHRVYTIFSDLKCL